MKTKPKALEDIESMLTSITNKPVEDKSKIERPIWFDQPDLFNNHLGKMMGEIRVLKTGNSCYADGSVKQEKVEEKIGYLCASTNAVRFNTWISLAKKGQCTSQWIDGKPSMSIGVGETDLRQCMDQILYF